MTKSIKNIGEAIAYGTHLLDKENAIIDARALLLDCLGFEDYGEMLAKTDDPIPTAALSRYEQYLQQRQTGQPIAYILGWREFYGRKFRTTPAALIPRPETEHIVTAALWHLPPDKQATVLDMGTGCGAIGVSIALDRPQTKIYMTDVDKDTLALAKQNATKHKINNAVFYHANWYEAIKNDPPMDMIICNPPYVAEGDSHLRQGDLRFEPPLALCGGIDGLAALKHVISNAPNYLRRGGLLLVEHGFEQADVLQSFFANAGFCGIRRLCDHARLERVMLGVRP